jgi:hypothetical protein
VEVLRSALRHDVGPEDIEHVVRKALSSRRSPKTPFGSCFSALIAQEDFLRWW